MDLIVRLRRLKRFAVELGGADDIAAEAVYVAASRYFAAEERAASCERNTYGRHKAASGFAASDLDVAIAKAVRGARACFPGLWPAVRLADGRIVEIPDLSEGN